MDAQFYFQCIILILLVVIIFYIIIINSKLDDINGDIKATFLQSVDNGATLNIIKNRVISLNKDFLSGKRLPSQAELNATKADIMTKHNAWIKDNNTTSKMDSFTNKPFEKNTVTKAQFDAAIKVYSKQHSEGIAKQKICFNIERNDLVLIAYNVEHDLKFHLKDDKRLHYNLREKVKNYIANVPTKAEWMNQPFIIKLNK